MKALSVTVQDMAGLDTLRPVTGGIPVAEGEAPDGTVFILQDPQGNPVPLQASVLARWKDESARWVLLDFQSAPSAHGRREYTLIGAEGAEEKAPAAACKSVGAGPVVQSGDVSVSATGDALLSISERLDVVLSLVDAEGRSSEGVVDSAEVETAGKMRSTLSLVGAFHTPDRGRLFQFRLRASIYAGLSAIRLEPLILMDMEKGVIQHIRELKLTLRLRGNATSARLGGDPGGDGPVASDLRLFQYDDAHYSLQGIEGEEGKAPGWGEVEDEMGVLALALRDFWQQWPKSVEAAPEGVSIGLFPRFREGDYAHMEPWYKHQYLFEGDCYRIRTGQARRWDVWVDLDGNGASLAKMADAPLLPIADPAQAIATGVWDAIAPAGTLEMADYDAWAENLFNAYCHSIEVQRDYGAMNWGDWFGERQVNWGNHEYDTANQILIQFARTGDPGYFYVADAAVRHASEVDTVHCVNEDLIAHLAPPSTYPARPGIVHQHTVGHVSGFYSEDRVREAFVAKGVGDSARPYLCLDTFNLGHIWTQGMARHYFLTGDPFVKETVEKIGKNLAQLVEDRAYRFMGHSHCGRTAGWPLLALGGAYEIGFDERYLNAMKGIVDEALDDQDSNCGGWLYELAWGHCRCEKRHVGMVAFLTAILINGLSRYAFLSGDDRLPDAVNRAMTFLKNDAWREEWHDWQYTSCPASHHANQAGVLVLAYVNGFRITEDPDSLRILGIAWEAKFKRLLDAPKPGPGLGKTYSSTMNGCAEAIGLLAAEGAIHRV